MSWTDERVEQLKKLWAQGYSASQIAKELTGTTRNAVIGKIHRLNLVARQSPKTTPPLLSSGASRMQKPLGTGFSAKLPPSKPSEYMAPAAAFASLSPAAAAVAYDPADMGVSARGTRLEAHNPFKTSAKASCQWPVGDPRSVGFHFCGANAQEGFSYCGEHARMAYQPVNRKRIGLGNTDLHATGTPDEREISVRY